MLNKVEKAAVYIGQWIFLFLLVLIALLVISGIKIVIMFIGGL